MGGQVVMRRLLFCQNLGGGGGRCNWPPAIDAPVEVQLVDDDVVNVCPRHLSSGSQMQDNARVFLIPFSLDFFIKSRFSQTSLSWTKKRTNKKVATWKNLGKTFSWESALWVPFQRAQTSTSGSKTLQKKIHYIVNRPFNLHPEKWFWGCHLRFSRAWT